MSKRYRSVVFLDSPEDFDRWYVEFDEDKGEGFEYLLQWEYGDDGEISDTPPWGALDTLEYFDSGDLSYVVSYNWGLSYVSLTQILENEAS